MNEKEILCPKCGHKYDTIAHFLVCPHCGTPTHVQDEPWFIEIKDETFKIDKDLLQKAAWRYADNSGYYTHEQRMLLWAGFIDGTMTLLHLLSL